MKLARFSLRLRIFIAMILLVLLASILIAGVTIYQYNEEAREYHQDRLERKEENIQASIDYTIKETTYEVKPEMMSLIFKDAIYQIATIHNMEINLYNLDGGLLKSSKASFDSDSLTKCLDAKILNTISHSLDHRYVNKTLENNDSYLSSYSIITDKRFKPLAILNLHYLENDDFLNKELQEFLERLSYAYFVMLIIAIGLAYLLSKYITKSLKTISDKMNETRFETGNKKIDIGNTSQEIAILVKSYNSMIDELEASAVKLATSEREQAWREMAKQVAHEIKNPLTPMRLSVQSFQRKFDPEDPNIHQKVDEYSKTLIQQIDTMSSIASAFSNFAKMPAQQNETLNVFLADKKEIIANFDRTQLIRVVTNLVKNGIQAIPEDSLKTPKIVVEVRDDDDFVNIIVTDNGKGISEENMVKIFEPKFTTKTSGMGLGLGMVKNIVETYNGNITFTSQLNEGTTFTVTIPKK